MREVNYYKGFYSPNPNDRRGELFTYRSIDNDKVAEGFKSGKGLSVAECKYYEPNVKTDPRVRDQDINQEYIKFIVDVARWHRYIDSSHVTQDVENLITGGNHWVAGNGGGEYFNDTDGNINGSTIGYNGMNIGLVLYGNNQYNISPYLVPIAIAMALLTSNNPATDDTCNQAIMNGVHFNAFMALINAPIRTEIDRMVTAIFAAAQPLRAAITGLNQGNLADLTAAAFKVKLYDFYSDKIMGILDNLNREIITHNRGGPLTTAIIQTYRTTNGQLTPFCPMGQLHDIQANNLAAFHTEFVDFLGNVFRSTYRQSPFYQRRDLGDNNMWKWFQNTLKGFNSFPNNIKTFYKNFLNIAIDGEGFGEIDAVIDRITDQNTARKFRVNLKRTLAGNVIFSDAFPLLIANTEVWFTLNAKVQAQSPANANLFKTIYDTVYAHPVNNNNIDVSGGLNIMLPVPEITFDTTETYFNFDLDGLFKSILKEAIQAPIGSDVDDFPEDTIEVDNQFTGRAYYKGGILMWKDGDEEKKVEDYDYLTKRHKCFSTQLGINEEECTNYIFKCVFSTKDDNYTDCEAVFGRRDIFPKDISVFNNAHPYIMFRTVQKLKFLAKKEIVDKIVLNKLESLDDWIKRHKADTNSAVHTLAITIEGNVDAQNYLKNLVSYINGNPEIINKNYKKKEGSLGKVNPEDPYGLSYPRRLITDMSLQQLGTIINNTNKNLFVKNSPLGLMMGPYLFNGMVGGSQMFTVDNTPRGWKALSNTLAVYRRKLVTYNKSLSPNTERKLKAKIEDVKKYEESTAKYINYIKQYNEIIEKLGDYTQNTSLSMAELMEVVNNNYNKLIEKKSRKEGQIISAIDALRDAVISEGKKAGDSDPLGAIQHTPITLDSLDPLVK